MIINDEMHLLEFVFIILHKEWIANAGFPLHLENENGYGKVMKNCNRGKSHAK